MPCPAYSAASNASRGLSAPAKLKGVRPQTDGPWFSRSRYKPGMTEPTSKNEQRRQHIREARAWLQERFPAVFGAEAGAPPLAIGAHQQAHETARAEGGPQPWAIQAAIGGWVKHPRYLQGLKAQRTRRHLDGTEAQAVTDEQAEHARKELQAKRRKKAVARENERQRQAKLAAKQPSDQNRVARKGSETDRASPVSPPPQESNADDATASEKATPKGPGGRPLLTLKKNRQSTSRRQQSGGQ